VAFHFAFQRNPDESELAAASGFLRSQTARYAGTPDAARQALVDYCHALLGSNEFLHLP
jgi:hypothetical protein